MSALQCRDQGSERRGRGPRGAAPPVPQVAVGLMVTARTLYWLGAAAVRRRSRDSRPLGSGAVREGESADRPGPEAERFSPQEPRAVPAEPRGCSRGPRSMLLPTAHRLASPTAALPSPRVGSCLLLLRLLFFPFHSGCDAVSLGPRVVPGPLASFMLMRRRRGGGRRRSAAARGSPPQMRRGWKPWEEVLMQKESRQAPAGGCASRGADSVSPTGWTLGSRGPSRLFPPSPLEGARNAAYPQPHGKGRRRGLQISASAWIRLQRARIPRGEPRLCASVLAAGRWAATGAAPGTDPPTFL